MFLRKCAAQKRANVRRVVRGFNILLLLRVRSGDITLGGGDDILLIPLLTPSWSSYLLRVRSGDITLGGV